MGPKHTLHEVRNQDRNHSPPIAYPIPFRSHRSVLFLSVPVPQVQVGKLELNVGPSELTAVVFRQESWRMFDFGFLRIWGGRYAPAIKNRHQWSRWFTSIFVHESFNHVTSNMLLWLVLGLYLVRKTFELLV